MRCGMFHFHWQIAGEPDWLTCCHTNIRHVTEQQASAQNRLVRSCSCQLNDSCPLALCAAAQWLSLSLSMSVLCCLATGTGSAGLPCLQESLSLSHAVSIVLAQMYQARLSALAAASAVPAAALPYAVRSVEELADGYDCSSGIEH